MVTMGVFPFQGKTYMLEPGIELGTSWLVVRSSDHQATRLVTNEIFSPSNKIHWEVGRAKDLLAPRYIVFDTEDVQEHY